MRIGYARLACSKILMELALVVYGVCGGNYGGLDSSDTY
jgi:hypothetical protein